MAKVIQKRNQCDNVLQLISWKEIVQIYFQSFLIVIYILVKNFLILLKKYFDKKFCVTRRVFERFRVLSTNNSKERRAVKCYDNEAITPFTFTSQFGVHKYIKIKTSRFHYVEKGDENDRVILLLHGFPDCFFGWRNQIDVLSQTHRVIALDLKGFNDSDKPSLRYYYKPNRVINELKCFIDALDIKSVCIIGHDLGAILGWIFTLKHPDNVNKFISISTPHPNLYWNSMKGSTLTNFWFNMIQIPILPERELCKDQILIHHTHKHLMEVDSEKNNNNSSNLMQTYEYIFSRASDWTGPLNYFRNLFFYRVNSSFIIRCPCILIFGTENSNFKLDSAIKSAEYCENPQIKIIDGGDYWIHQTHPKELNEILLKYLIGERKNDEESEDEKSSGSSPFRKSLVGRMMNKVYSVSQQYGTIPSSSNGSGRMYSG